MSTPPDLLERLQHERAEALVRASAAERRSEELERRLAALEGTSRRQPKAPTAAGELATLADAFERIPQLRRAVEDALEPQTRLNLRILEIEAKSRSADRLVGLLAIALPHAVGALSERHGKALQEAIQQHEEQIADAAAAVEIEPA